MKRQTLHPWTVSTQEARSIQERLASKVSRANAISASPKYVVGVDLSPQDSRGVAKAAAVVVSYPELGVCEVRCAEGKPGFPYVPGLLSFREAPLVLEALGKLVLAPDLILVDGQGLAHPRRFGLACHVGLLTEVPTIGCAKSVLLGEYGTLEVSKGAWAELVDRGEVVGAAVRSRQGVSPIYVSIGHKVDLPSAICWTLACCRVYRLPEPTRLAHQAAAGRIPEGVRPQRKSQESVH